MTKEKIEHFKEKLQEELKNLETELKTVGQTNSTHPGDWEPIPETLDIDKSDRNEVADDIVGFENNIGILNSLETRYNEIKDALQKIDDGKYAICEIGGEEIEEDRLGANPAAKTCKAHMS